MGIITPRWYQQEAVSACIEFLHKHPSPQNPLIVMPTGTGKSVVIAKIVEYIRQWPNNRVLMLTHVSELVQQNARKLIDIWPECNLGICAASLNLHDTRHDVLFGTVQTVASKLKRNKQALGYRNLIIIDECHLLSEKSTSQYRTVLNTLTELYPRTRVVGLSATPWRTKGGLLTEQEHPIFTHIAYDLNDQFVKLIEQGYLAPLTAPAVPVHINLEGVHVKQGDFDNHELQEIVGNDFLLAQASDVMCRMGMQRRSWLVFVSGIDNGESVAQLLKQRGISAIPVNSKHSTAENTKAINDFRTGAVRCLVSADQLTTGFDAPNVDLIALLRPTTSPGLHCQILGRGTRPCPGKHDCLVLDFARNIERLGPINAPKIPCKHKAKGKAVTPEDKEEFLKTCPQCGAVWTRGARSCSKCGYRPPQDLDLVHLNTAPVMYDLAAATVPGGHVASVSSWEITPHQGKSGQPCLRIKLFCHSTKKSNFSAHFYLVFAQNAMINTLELWRYFQGQNPVPTNFGDALTRINELKRPRAIELVRANHRTSHFDRLVKVYYGDGAPLSAPAVSPTTVATS